VCACGEHTLGLQLSVLGERVVRDGAPTVYWCVVCVCVCVLCVRFE